MSVSEYPPCIDCTDEPGSSPGVRCRDCDIEYGLARMECTACGRMRWDKSSKIAAFGQYLWGDPCTCDPRPATVAEERNEAKEVRR